MIDKTQAHKNGIKIIDSTKATNALFDMLQAQFPQTIKDGQPDLKAIANLLGLDSNATNRSGYELTFTGKGLANALYGSPCDKELKLQEIYGKNCNNVIIRGDNLDALKLLKSAYSEKIKTIYIDPSYNTQNDDFIYPDNFRDDYKKILEEVGLIEYDEEGKEKESKSLKFFRNIQGSRTHSGWLAFMLPRLKLARDLLREDGVIFISIDDNEQANLKLLCDEIFGEGNFVANIVWANTQGGGGSDSKHFRIKHEYILCYSKDKNLLQIYGLDIENIENYKFSDKHESTRGKYQTRDLSVGSLGYVESLDYPIKAPDGSLILANKNGEKINRWRWSKEKLKWGLANDFVEFKKNANGEWKIHTKMYLNCDNDGNLTQRKQQPQSFIHAYSNIDSNKQLKEIFDGKNVFDYSKPTNLIKHLLEISTNKPSAEENEGDIILDFFAGSGTTAHAVMDLNKEDGGNRKFILVQWDEIIEPKNAAAYNFCKDELKSQKPVISDITIERVKRVGAEFGIYSLANKPKIISNEDGALQLQSPTDLSALDKARNLALKSAKTLDKALNCIVENKLYACEDSYFCVECDESVLKALSQTSDEYIYIDAYSDINLEHF